MPLDRSKPLKVNPCFDHEMTRLRRNIITQLNNEVIKPEIVKSVRKRRYISSD